MSTETQTPADRARKSLSVVMERFRTHEAKDIAAATGWSETKVSNVKNERTEDVLMLLAHLGLKVVPAEFKCVEPGAYAFLTKTHEKFMRVAPQLIWEEAE